MASLSDDDEISMAISAPHRGAGLGSTLLVHVIQVAEQAVDVAPSRLELILGLPHRRTA